MNRRFRYPVIVALLMALGAAAHAQDKTLAVRPLSDAPSFAKRALVIGVGQYEHAGSLAPTTYNDARHFADLLRTQFKFSDDSITLLTDAPGTPDGQKPTYIHLLNAFKTLLDGVTDKSEVVVYYSGHGTRADNHDWLVPMDGLPSNVASTCINYDDFKNQLNTLTPARALLIVDACRNLSGGKDAGSSGFGASKALTGPQFAELLSCRPKEESKVGKPEDFEESVFTHFLLEGLKGDADAQTKGTVTFDSLNEYVQGHVSQYVSKKYGESQNPEGRASQGAMVIARVGSGTTPIGNGGSSYITKIHQDETPQNLTTPGATVLFDGTNLDAWMNTLGRPAAWNIYNGILVVAMGKGDIVTRYKYRDYQLHVEFNLANMPNKYGQNRSNSGVILNGQYEIQILDSVNNPTSFAEGCGAVFGEIEPSKNVCSPPGQWQTYDISFRSPRFDQYGQVREKPRLTLIWNGVKVHDSVQINAPNYPVRPSATMFPDGPIMLQDGSYHPAPVQFRNIWIKPLE